MTLYYVAPLGAGALVPSSVRPQVLQEIFQDKGITATARSLQDAYLFLPSAYIASLDANPFAGAYNFSIKASQRSLALLSYDGGENDRIAFTRCASCPHEMVRLLGDAPCALSAAEAAALRAAKLPYNSLHSYCASLATASDSWKRWLGLKVSVVYGNESIYKTDLYKKGSIEVQMVPSLKKWKAVISEWDLNKQSVDGAAALATVGAEGR